MTKSIPLSGKRGAGLFAIVDDQDYELVIGYTWHLHVGNGGNFYARAYIPGSKQQKIYMHQLITDRRRIDHRDGDGLNNTRDNLRNATPGQNSGNSRSWRGVSQYKCVYFDKRRGRWYAQITVNYHTRNLGMFATEEAAARAYDAAALEAWGEFACLNFPSP